MSIAPHREEEPSRRSRQDSIRLALVDDAIDTVHLYEQAFGRDGRFEIVGTAADGIDALALVESTDIDVLLLDLQMPRLDGFGVLRSLPCCPNGAKPRVVLVTGVFGGLDTDDLRRRGAAGYISKERPLAELIAGVLLASR